MEKFGFFVSPFENREDSEDRSEKASPYQLLNIVVAQLFTLGGQTKQWHCAFDDGLGLHIERKPC